MGNSNALSGETVLESKRKTSQEVNWRCDNDQAYTISDLQKLQNYMQGGYLDEQQLLNADITGVKCRY